MVQTVVQPDDMVRVTWRFSIGPTVQDRTEIQEFGIYGLAVPAVGATGDWQQYLKDLAHAAYTAWSGQVIASQWPTTLRLDSVLATRYNPLGRTKTEGVYVPAEVWSGTANGTVLPWQISLCVGLYTYTPGSFISDARSRRGRIFLPTMPAVILDGTTGHIDSGIADAHLAKTQLLIKETALMNGSTVAEWRWHPGILSKGPFKDGRLVGSFSALTDITLDTKLDTQRRRANRDQGVRKVAQYTGG